MKNIIEMIRGFFKQHKELRRSRSIILALAAVVVFATTYALILPALTLDEDAAAETPGITVEGEALTGDAAEVTADEQAAANAAAAEAAAEEQAAPEEPVAEAAAEEPAAEAVPEEAAPAETALAEAAAEEGQAAETQPSLDAETAETDGTQTEEPKEEAALITEPTTLEVRGNGCTIRVAFDGTALLPVGVQLQVHEITKDNDPEAYQSYFDRSQAKVKERQAPDTDTVLTYARFFDISFIDASGTEVEPSAAVDVRIVYDSDHAVDAGSGEDVGAVHFNEETNTTDEIKTENKPSGSDQEKVAEVGFQAENFSVYGVVGTQLYTEMVLPDSTEAYAVTVTAPAEARIPEGSTLRVEPFAEGSEKYNLARKAVLADKKAKNEAIDLNTFRVAALDISILDPDGKEIEPEALVTVDIKIKELPGVESLEDVKNTLEIQHHVEVDEGVVVEKVFDGSTEGSFGMDTDENIEKNGTAVDPASVNEEDFQYDADEDTGIGASFDTEVFSTFTISWDNAYGNGVTVHYVDENGVELDVDNSVFPTTIGSTSASPAHLIYDIDGYEYDHTYRRYWNVNRWSEQNIVPELTRRNSNQGSGWRYSTNGDNWYFLSASNATNKDEIYVVYKKKPDVTQGGSPTLMPVGPEDYPDAPSILKESDPNGDGTSDLSLSIVGHTKDREVEKLADVIVVFDISGSMSYGMSGSTRLAVAKNAVNNLVDSLATRKNSAGDPLIRMSLISFSTTATNEIGLTDLTATGVSAYKNVVAGLSAGGGTNWDDALQLANEQAVDSGRATFVIFVTDGDPTFRNTRTDINDSDLNNRDNPDISETYYLSDNVFGTGSGDARGNNYAAAVTQGQAIVAANKNLYTIGISTDVTKVSKFNTDAGGNGAYIAADADALNQAFSDIESAIIAKLGISNIQMTDGITELTQTIDKSGLTSTDGTFTYWKKAKGASTFESWDPASENCLEAEYDQESGAVTWNMGTAFMPEDGATYKVTWKVWPSQTAYDILAMCKNDPSYYDTLTDAQKAQIIRTGTAPDFTYSLKTNEPGAGITYQDATKTGTGIELEGDEKSIEFNEVNPLGLASSQISMKKVWDNQLDDREVTGSFDFPVTADGTDFGEVTLSSDQTPKWQNSYYISTGLMTTNPYVVYEKGHDYTIEEPVDLSYNWDFKSEVYHPMVINNETVILIKVDTAEESDYTIDGKFYKILSGDAVLTATNESRSNLNISKTVVDKDGNHVETDQAFTFTVTVNEGHDAEVWLSAYDTKTGSIVMDSSLVSGTGVVYESDTGYFHAPSGTTLTLILKDGWNYRFTNLSIGSTYSIEENSPVPEGFTFLKAEATATNSAVAGTVNGQKTEGTIDKSNSVYTAAYTNRANITTLKIRKVSEDWTTPLSGATIEIKKGPNAIQGSPFLTTAEDIELNLLDGIYNVIETEAPDGYVILKDGFYFKTADGVVTITDKDGNEAVYDDFEMTTEGDVIVLKVKNNPGKELPNTGGSGTLLYTMSGFALICAAALLYGFRMRRRERRFR